MIHSRASGHLWGSVTQLPPRGEAEDPLYHPADGIGIQGELLMPFRAQGMLHPPPNWADWWLLLHSSKGCVPWTYLKWEE